MSDTMFPEPMDQMDRAMQRMDKKSWAEADAEIALLKAQLAEAEARLEEATDLLGFAEARLLAFGQHNSSNPDYVLAMDAIKLFLMTADSASVAQE